MDNLRPVLLITLAFLAYLMWLEWQKDYAPVTVAAPAAGQQSQAASPAGEPDTSNPATDADATAADLPEITDQPEHPEPTAAKPSPTKQAQSRLVRVRTDVLDVEIDLVGGTVVNTRLLDYPIDLDEPEEKVQLLHQDGPNPFIAQSGLLSAQSAPNHTSEYQSASQDYVLKDGVDEISVPLSWQSADGVRVSKTFVFRRGDYTVEVSHRLDNQTTASWTGSRYDQLQRSVSAEETESSFTNPGSYSFTGIAFYSPADKFEKLAFDDVSEEPFNKTFAGGWLSMIQHYFFAAWIPPGEETNTYSTKEISAQGQPRYLVRNVSSAYTVEPGQQQTFSSRLYLGPKLQEELEAVAPGLEYTVNYGIFTVFSKPLFWLLSHIHSIVGNWGWAIVLLTILIKGAFFKLTEAQYRSMARMRKLQPRIEQLKERYGDDRQRMSQAMMEMYKTEKVNPLGGCLPILVQIPIFIALYWVLLESVELRQAPFILWIDNLSVRDPYFILPALNAIFMIWTQKLTPMAGMDPLQRKMMNMMPVVFAVMFAFFPAGLVLYWATNAGLSLAQQVYITRKIEAGADKK
ncbi:MAG TPA: membrane protein insertase YidC [Xanthomonadales bacterium]|nr:membrane protein insertase YidC [Xanthomonadales bacterium]